MLFCRNCFSVSGRLKTARRVATLPPPAVMLRIAMAHHLLLTRLDFIQADDAAMNVSRTAAVAKRSLRASVLPAALVRLQRSRNQPYLEYTPVIFGNLATIVSLSVTVAN